MVSGLCVCVCAGTGFQIPQYAANALSQAGSAPPPVPSMPQPNGQLPPLPPAAAAAPPIATQCFMLSNMFDSGS